MRWMAASIGILTVTSLLLARTPTSPAIDLVVVYKHERRLALLFEGKEVRSYRVALGGDPIGPKNRQGDHKTPEGSYVLDS